MDKWLLIFVGENGIRRGDHGDTSSASFRKKIRIGRFSPPRSVVVAVIRGTGLKRKLEEFRALPCWESVSRADPLFCRSLRIRPTPVSHADALFLLSLSPFSPKQRDFLGKWPRSCPKWQRVVNAVSPRFSPLDSCPPLLAPTCQLPFQCLLHLSRVLPSP